MGQDGLGKFQAHGHEEGGPVDGVEAEDVLAHDLEVRRPGPFRCAREVVQQRVEPHIDHMLLVAGNWNAPVDAGAADAQVLEAAFHEALYFVEAEIRLHEVGMRRVPLQQGLLVLGEAEVVGLLFQLDKLVRETLGLQFLGLHLGDKGLVADTVEPFVGGLVDIASLKKLLEPRLYHLAMILIRRADEAEVGHVHPLPEVRVVRHDLVGQGLGGDAAGGGGLLHLLAMFVGAGEEESLLSHLPVEPRDGVRQHSRVDMPDMGPVVHIVDGRRQVEGLGHSKAPSLPV